MAATHLERATRWNLRIDDPDGHGAVLRSLTRVDNLVRRVVAIKANPPAYTGIVADLGDMMEGKWNDAVSPLVHQAAAELAALGESPKGTKGKAKAIIKQLEKDIAAAGVEAWGDEDNAAVLKYLAASYKLGKTETLQPVGWKAGFDVVDQDVVHGLANAGVFWIGDQYTGNGLNTARILAIVEQAEAEGLGRDEIGARLQRELGGQHERSRSYWRGLAATVATRSRSFGALAGMHASGATTYTYVNPDDERTSPVCRELNGKSFTVKMGLELRDRLLATKDPDGWKAISPWPKARDLEAPGGGLLSSAELAAKGIAWPPLHFHCRSSIDVETWAPISEADLGDVAYSDTPINPVPKPPRKPRTPKPKPLPRANVIMHEQTGSAAGSNEGGFYTGADGVARYVKVYADPTQAIGEHMSNQLYRDLGLEAPESELFQTPEGKQGYASVIVPNKGNLGNVLSTAGSEIERKRLATKALEGFAADVLTANWDAAGLDLDNMILTNEGAIARIDNGGALLSRAQGARKPGGALAGMDEWWKYFDGSNPGYARLTAQAGIKRAQHTPEFLEQVDRIEALRKKSGGWAKYVAKHAPALSDDDHKAIVELLESRTTKLAQKAADWRLVQRMNELEAAKPYEQWNVDKAKTWGDAHLKPVRKGLTKEVKRELRSYTGSAYSWINDRLREGRAPTDEDKLRDAGIAGSKLPQDMVLWRGTNFCEPLWDTVKGEAKSEGTLSPDKAYRSATIVKSATLGGHSAKGIMYRIYAPKGTKGVWVDDFSENEGEREILIGRNEVWRVLYVEIDDKGVAQAWVTFEPS